MASALGYPVWVARWLRSTLPLFALVTVACDDGAGINPNPTPDGGMGRCLMDSDCPDRNKCNVGIGVCYSIDQCSSTVPCPNAEQICVEKAEGNVCEFERCEEDSECQDLSCDDPNLVPACVSGGCICGVPCNGGCPDRQGCCIPTEQCLDLPPECLGLNCPPGEFVSVTSSGAWDLRQCMFLGETCACEKLPPLPLGDIGLYQSMTHDGTSAMIAAYNLDYGDLMFGLAQSDGSIDWEFIDGVPATSTIGGAIDGPRGGKSEPGDDVGLYTDLVADSGGRPHVVYQDRGRGALKYGRQDTSGWLTYELDGAGVGDTGLYSSLALDGNQQPVVAYLSARIDQDRQRVSVLRLAQATNAAPATVADWRFRDLVVTDLSGYPCEERCNLDEVCLDSNQACVVPSPASACNPTCGNREACINGTCQATNSLAPFRDLPVARGLWPEVKVLPNGDALIAYYDRVDRNLRMVRIAGPDLITGTLTSAILEGVGAPVPTGQDTGLYPSLFVTPGGEVHLSYQNASRQALLYRNIDPANLQTLAVEDVEVGLGMGMGPDGLLLGADSALVVDSQGTVRIAYQDATNGDLRYARRDGVNSWVRLTLAGAEMPYAGSYGFYSDQCLSPDRSEIFVSTYRYFLSGSGGPRNGVALFSPP